MNEALCQTILGEIFICNSEIINNCKKKKVFNIEMISHETL